ncbi:PREDICTED: protein SCAI [Camelina sativa]|uniref:Protein SCAI n=1 Tax=Camelina sativa TaxID=90675 RepID=A0ABM0U7J5_CAMSA|nr:PREDICTED: protein SCAI [Camelina sativa]
MAGEDVSRNFRALVENADRKFARVRDLPAFGRAQSHYFHKVFKAYMKLWNYQQSHRSKLVDSGLNRWEIGEIASRIGQLYFSQYMRTSEARFLLEAYVFYEAILRRRYFEGEAHGKDLGARFKELRFYARFLLVSLIVDRKDMVLHLADKLRVLVDDSKSNFRETNFKEWRLVVQEITRFIQSDTDLTYVRPLRYCAMLDSYPASQTYLARFHAKKLFKFRDALLASYHRNEVKYAEVTLDTYRMMQCLEWEPSGSFYQKKPVETKENGFVIDHTLTSGLIDMKLAADMADPTLPPNPRKAILYRPSVSHLLAVLAMICDELSPECVMLIYLSASGGPARENVAQAENSVGSSRTSKSKLLARGSQEQKSYKSEPHSNGKMLSSDYYEDHLWLGPRGGSGSNNLYPGDLIPFTRKPLFLIIDSDTSRAFKVLSGAERGEPVAMLLSPLKPSFENPSTDDTDALNGSQFTFFLTAPLQAFSQMLGLSNSNPDPEVYDEAESMLSASFSEWETILLTSKVLNLVWAQVLPDPFLRRLILRFIFCRSVLTSFSRTEDDDPYLPQCHPNLPELLSPVSKPVQSSVQRLADHLGVAKSFHFNKT